jgi:N-acetylglucosamine-6-phosphate deacetylase
LVEAGATMLTHLGNGMPHNVHKFNNPFVCGLTADELSAGIIADGHHLPPQILKTIIRTKGMDNVFVVSDSIYVAGL